MVVTETNIDILESRVRNGITYCADLWNQMLAAPESEWDGLSVKLDKSCKTLRELNTMLNYQGYTACVFGEPCRFDDKTHICFVCSKREAVQ